MFEICISMVLFFVFISREVAFRICSLDEILFRFSHKKIKISNSIFVKSIGKSSTIKKLEQKLD